jgi:formylglycine-generating enzyme required for sulfatase activity
VAGFFATAGSVGAQSNTIRTWPGGAGDLGTLSAVVGGGSHFLALTRDGAVKAWGGNGNGQCDVPTDLGSVKAIGVGSWHSLAVRQDGVIRCWGYNGVGQCNVPISIGPALAVSGGAWHSIALLSDHTVICWGENGSGQCAVPVNLGYSKAITAGYYHSVALKRTGEVRCWGENYNGQCAVPSELPAARAIAAGMQYTLALLENGTLRGWGWLAPPSDLVDVVAIAGGNFHCVALTRAGQVRCWGYNLYGECDPPTDLVNVSAVGAGPYQSVAIEGPLPDGDSDGVPDLEDNCLTSSNPDQADCNDDAVGDACEIAGGVPDVNGNGSPDRCECLGDLVPNGRIDGADLSIMLAQWGPASSMTSANLNGDGFVDGVDLSFLLAAWGPCAPFVPSWAEVIEAQPDPEIVTNPTARSAISGSGLAWRIRDKLTKIEMLLVPSGTFHMGCIMPADAEPCRDFELPAHEVTISQPFYLGRYEVTQAQWMETMGSNPSVFQGFDDSTKRPVEMVSWQEIQHFLQTTNLRLPTDAEWEFACRAGTDTPFSIGTTVSWYVQSVAWVQWNAGWRTHPVGLKPPNNLGFQDMHGNVWEWVSDWYENYASIAQVDPIGPPSGDSKITRGGSAADPFTYVRSSYRQAMSSDATSRYIGFRVARDPGY